MTDRAAASAGFVVAGIALAIAAVALPGGHVPGIVAAGVSLAGFAVRRYGLLDARVGAAIAGVGGIGLLVAGPLAARTGGSAAGAIVLGSAGSLAVAAAYADYRRIPRDRLEAKGAAAVTAGVIGAFGLLAILVWYVTLAGVVGLVVPVSAAVQIALSSVAGGLGTASVTYLYVRFSDRGLGFIDVPRPTRRDLGYVAAGVVAIIGLNLLIGTVFDRLGVESARHGILRVAESNPEILLVLIPLSFVFIGPGEELLYRNVVQKSLYETFSRPAAIAVASVVFGIVHVFSFSGAGDSALATVNALAIVFTLSLVLGAVYERTGSVIVAALVHAAHDAIGFAATYAELTGRFDPPAALAVLVRVLAALG